MAMESQGGVVTVLPIKTDVVTQSTKQTKRPKWINVEPDTYECCVHITEEEDGFSVNMPSLPGVVSEGDTEEEAIANIKEAFQCIVESYRKDDEEIPWVKSPEPPEKKAKELWIVVHA